MKRLLLALAALLAASTPARAEYVELGRAAVLRPHTSWIGGGTRRGLWLDSSDDNRLKLHIGGGTSIDVGGLGDPLSASQSIKQFFVDGPTGGYWQWKQGLDGPGDFFRLNINDNQNTPWGTGVAINAQPDEPGGRSNPVYINGWNCKAGGSIVPFEASGCFHLEQYYWTGTGAQMERYESFQAPGQPGHRIFEWNGDVTTGEVTVGIFGNTVSIGGGTSMGAGASIIFATPTGGYLRAPDGSSHFYVDNSTLNMHGAGKNVYVDARGLAVAADVIPTGDRAVYLGSRDAGGVPLRWKAVYATSAAVSLPTCSGIGDEGAITVAEGAAGVGSTLQVCMKGTDDAYAWRTVFTAP